MKIIPALLAAVALLTATGSNANLVGSADGQTVYDTDLNVTWLANANLAVTNTFGVSGIVYGSMNWNTAQSWIGAMNTANYLGYNDWRLPTGSNLCYGFTCTSGEIAHLFINELGVTAGHSIYSSLDSDKALFTNLYSGKYWSSTESDASHVFVFDTAIGLQPNTSKDNFDGFYALAVRAGQVTAVPAPTAAWLLGSGLLGLVGVARCKAA